jgi:hypothetical protein
MCMNCGCGQLDTRHKDTDIVGGDIQKAADGQGLPKDETVRNLESSLQQLRSERRNPTASRTATGTSRY